MFPIGPIFKMWTTQDEIEEYLHVIFKFILYFDFIHINNKTLSYFEV
jgi:hypothetical protein